MTEKGALESITVRAAEILGVSDKYGTISVGKAPDLVLMTGSPLSLESDVLLVIGSGRVVVDFRR